jgi:CDP-glucose 4,6-dehydratase
MLQAWGGGEWIKPDGAQPHEATLLRLDCTKARTELGWRPRFRLADALDKVVEWHKGVAEGGDARAISLAQIEDYIARG